MPPTGFEPSNDGTRNHALDLASPPPLELVVEFLEESLLSEKQTAGKIFYIKQIIKGGCPATCYYFGGKTGGPSVIFS
jgi:hypothetical protein